MRQVENEKDVGVLEAKGTKFFKEGIMINCLKSCTEGNYWKLVGAGNADVIVILTRAISVESCMEPKVFMESNGVKTELEERSSKRREWVLLPVGVWLKMRAEAWTSSWRGKWDYKGFFEIGEIIGLYAEGNKWEERRELMMSPRKWAPSSGRWRSGMSRVSRRLEEGRLPSLAKEGRQSIWAQTKEVLEIWEEKKDINDQGRGNGWRGLASLLGSTNNPL